MRRFFRILTPLTLFVFLFLIAALPVFAAGVRTSALEIAPSDWWPTLRGKNSFGCGTYSDIAYMKSEVMDYGAISTFIPVKPHTEYRMTARVRVDGYEASGKQSGLRLLDNHTDTAARKSAYCTSSDWTTLELDFKTGDETYRCPTFAFGDAAAPCRGTCWIKSMIIEEKGAAPVKKPVFDNTWNILCLIFRYVDTGSVTDYFSPEEVEEIVRVVPQYGLALDTLSDSVHGVRNMDFYFIDEPLRTLSGPDLEPTLGPIGDIDLSQYLDGYDYQEVEIYVPLWDHVDWAAVSCREYWYQSSLIYVNIIASLSDVGEEPYQLNGESYDGDTAMLIHCHMKCVADNAQWFNGYRDEIDILRGLTADSTLNDWLKHDSELMRNALSDGEGFSPAAFEVTHYDPNGKLGIWRENFGDVYTGEQWYKAAQFACLNGLFNGVYADRFDPRGNMTRAMFVTVMGRFAGVDGSKYTGVSFRDVQPGQWYTPYVAWAESAGIVKGYTDGTFGVNDPVTVEQAAVILRRYAEYLGMDVSVPAGASPYFADMDSVSDWARDGIGYVTGRSLFRGVNGWLYPQKYASRIQVAEMLMNLAFVAD